jgi:hypothetical protein
MLRMFRPSRQRGDPGTVACAGVNQGRDVHRQAPVEEAKLKVAVMDRDRVSIVGIVGLPRELERRARAQARNRILPAFERDPRNLGVKSRRVGDR